jgi:hypothetical protein
LKCDIVSIAAWVKPLGKPWSCKSSSDVSCLETDFIHPCQVVTRDMDSPRGMPQSWANHCLHPMVILREGPSFGLSTCHTPGERRSNYFGPEESLGGIPQQSLHNES